MKKLNYHWLNPKLVVKDTRKYGKGVFAGEDIKKDFKYILGYVIMLQYLTNIKSNNGI